MNTDYSPSENLYIPKNGQLKRRLSLSSHKEDHDSCAQIEMEIKNLVSQKDYPCVAALKSYHKDDYQVGFYKDFGNGSSWRSLRNDLLFFLSEQKKTNSPYLSFWAIFDPTDLSEEKFELDMWTELSNLTSVEDKQFDWPKTSNSNPEDKSFRFGLGGSEFFVVGLHSNSSRNARKFSRPVLIFNIFEQFELLAKQGLYYPMIETNRKRDEKFQGFANPMAVQHNDDWEAIQFSGKKNPTTWKCPFRFLKSLSKP